MAKVLQLVAAAIVLLALLACQRVPVRCCDTLSARGSDYDFVTKSVPEFFVGSLVTAPPECKTLHLPTGTRLKLRQVCARKAKLCAPIIPSWFWVTRLSYRFERVEDGLACEFSAVESDAFMTDQELMSPHGSRLIDKALENESFCTMFAPLHPAPRKPRRIVSQSEYLKKK